MHSFIIATTDLILKTLKNNQMVTKYSQAGNCKDAEIIGLSFNFFWLTLATSHLVRAPIFNNNMEDPGVRSSTKLTFAMSRQGLIPQRNRSSSFFHSDVFLCKTRRAATASRFPPANSGFRHLQLQLNYTCKQT